MSPTNLRQIVVFHSDLGWQGLAWQGDKLAELTFGHQHPGSARTALQSEGEDVEPNIQQEEIIARIQAFAAGAKDEFRDIRLDFCGRTDFQRRVLQTCRRIGYGNTLTYAELATKAGSPRAARAVGSVMRSNQVPLLIPCHRVVGAGGALGGYSGASGVRMKLRLLEQEMANL